jgi:hypothetical protein
VKLCLVYRQDPTGTDAASGYVTRLLPAVSEEHRTTAVAIEAGVTRIAGATLALRRRVEQDPPEIVHLHNLGGLALAAVLWAVDRRVPVALSLHNLALLGRLAMVNQRLTSTVGLIISPSHHLLDQYRERGFFRTAITQILPYGIEPGPRPRSADYVVIRSASAESDFLGIVDAFQSGAVVILTRSGGASELVRDGVNGLLVESGDEAAIVAAIERLRGSPELAARLRAAALDTARLYDMRFHLAHLTAAYRQLLNASRAGDLDRRAA